MKLKSIFFAFTVASIIACNSLSKKNTDLENATLFGDTFNDTSVTTVTMDSLYKLVPLSRPLDAVFSGKVQQVCQSRGCWIKLEATNGQSVFVDTDEKITMPKSIVGKNVAVNGYAFMDTTDVETLRHYAKDEGKSKEEIEKITAPLVEVSIRATGIKIK